MREASFEFYVIETVPGSREQRLLVETKYLQKFHDGQKQCYNFCKEARSKERICWSKTPEETKKILSERMKKFWADPQKRKAQSEFVKELWKDPEYRSQQIKSSREASKKIWKNPEYVQKRKNARYAFLKDNIEYRNERRQQMLAANHAFKPKSYLLRNPKGKIICIKNLTKFCAENKIPRSGMHRVVYGIVSGYMGWTLPDMSKSPKSKKYLRKLVSPQGTIYSIYNATKFCRDNPAFKLSPAGISKLTLGQIKSHKGWILA